MEEEPLTPAEPESFGEEMRCPNCDSVVPADSAHCIMCGSVLEDETLANDAESTGVPLQELSQSAVFPAPAVVIQDKQEQKRKLKSRVLWLLIGMTVLITAYLGFLILRNQGSEVILALQPTFTPIPDPPTLTPTWTPVATETPLATDTPVPSATPFPTDTPRAPRYHSVAGGETLFGLSLLYRVTMDSIAEANEIPVNSPIQVGQELNIPWPTATPPLESMVLKIRDDEIVADVTDCEIVTIQEGDSTYGLSARYDVPAEAIVAVNRLTDESIQMLHPGDTLCIPRVMPGNSLPPTVGPPPTASSTAYPAGPTLLYPTEGAEIDTTDGLLRLQWVAVKDLEDSEWYMVEMTDLESLDSLPYRAFTRDTSLRVPVEWRPTTPETHQMRWRVSIVNVTGERSDGGIIYDYGGSSHEDSHFFWQGVVPTSTPTITPMPAPEEF